MHRRQLLLAGALGGLAAGVEDQAALAAPSDITPADGLNPPGIRVAGIRMLPVVGGLEGPADAHMDMWDDQETYFKHLLGFLKTV